MMLAALAALAMIAALVGLPQTAEAAPYPGTQKTRTVAAGVAPKHAHQARVFVKVTSFRHGKPTGKLDFNLVNKRTGKVTTASRSYDGPHRYKFNHLARGRYSIVVNYIPPAGSKYKPSSAKAIARVHA